MVRAVPRHRRPRQGCALTAVPGAALAARECDARRAIVMVPPRPCYGWTRWASASLCAARTRSRTRCGVSSDSPCSYTIAQPSAAPAADGFRLYMCRVSADVLKETFVVLYITTVVSCHTPGNLATASHLDLALTRCCSCAQDPQARACGDARGAGAAPAAPPRGAS
jgi:hypothetical protein